VITDPPTGRQRGSPPLAGDLVLEANGATLDGRTIDGARDPIRDRRAPWSA
jgi:hypothetical protein